MRQDAEIKLVRHGQSKSNTREMNPREEGDHKIPLSPLGEKQAIAAGEGLKDWLKTTSRDGLVNLQGAEPLIYCSPYLRTRQTLKGIMEGADFQPKAYRVYEDPRLRETERGYADYHDSIEEELREREHYGWFYYRFQGGESPADCYDRASTFLESMARQIERKRAKKILIVTHGLFIRCFVMRFLHMSVEEFERIDNPKNCAAISIVGGSHACKYDGPMYRNGNWGLHGVEWRDEEE